MNIDWTQLITADMKARAQAEQETAEWLAEVSVEMAQRRLLANDVITFLQDIADVEVASAKEVTTLHAWKSYRLALSRLSRQIEYPIGIAWPEPPNLPIGWR